jgi:hypothetical protein
VNRVAFLFDEHFPVAAANAILGFESSICLRIVGTDPDAPPKRTPDPDLLRYAEEKGFAIVTFDKETMPAHADVHIANGHHTCGVFVFPKGYSLNAGIIADELVMIWDASTPDEWIDRTVFLPM